MKKRKNEANKNQKGIVGKKHPQTSKDAAEAIFFRSGTQREKLFLFVAKRKKRGATDFEIREALGLRYSSGCARRQELVKLKLLKESGRTRPTDTGQEAIVWVRTKKGRALYEQQYLGQA